MGGRKFRLGRHRKNEERKRKLNKEACKLTICSLVVSLPLGLYMNMTVCSLKSLSARLEKSSSLPPSWFLASTDPLVLCKVALQQGTEHSSNSSLISISVSSNMRWKVSIADRTVAPPLCPLLSIFPVCIASVSALHQLVHVVDVAKLCCGSRDQKYLDMWRRRSLTLHGSSGENRECAVVSLIDVVFFQGTVWGTWRASLPLAFQRCATTTASYC